MPKDTNLMEYLKQARTMQALQLDEGPEKLVSGLPIISLRTLDC